jgi:hypothetical protein
MTSERQNIKLIALRMNGKESRIIRPTWTVTERTCQKRYALRDYLTSFYVKNAIRMSDNMASNGIMIGEMEDNKHLPNMIC